MSEQQDKPYDGDTVRDGVTIASKTSRWVKAGMLGLAGLLAMTGVAYVTAKAVTPEVVVFDMKGRLTSSCSSPRSCSSMKAGKSDDGVSTRR
jgi:hypothetical protein